MEFISLLRTAMSIASYFTSRTVTLEMFFLHNNVTD